MRGANWTHAVCEACWFRTPGLGLLDADHVRRPVRVRPVEDDVRQCCLCQAPTVAGIFVRRDPRDTPLCMCPEEE